MNTPIQARLRNTVGLLSLAVVFSGCAHSDTVPFPAPQTAAPQAPLPVWQANYPATNYLAPEVSLKGCAIRPPLGYNADFADLLAGLQPYGLGMSLWTSDANTLNHSSLGITSVQRRNSYDARDVLNATLGPSERNISDFVQTKPETGTINGVTFARTYWQGTEKNASGNYAVSGFAYVTAQPTEAIMITGDDKVPCTAEPCHYQPLNMPVLSTIEAAALTFRKL